MGTHPGIFPHARCGCRNGGTGWLSCRRSSLGEVLTPEGAHLGCAHESGQESSGAQEGQTITLALFSSLASTTIQYSIYFTYFSYLFSISPARIKLLVGEVFFLLFIIYP